MAVSVPAPAPSEPQLPLVITGLIQAIKTRDSTAFIQSFSIDGLLIDEAKPYPAGPAMKGWVDKALFGHNATITVQHTSIADSTTCHVHVMMDGDFETDYGIKDPFPLYFHFQLASDGRLIHLLRINDIPPTEPTMRAVWAAGSNAEDPLSCVRSDVRLAPSTPVPDGWVRVKISTSSINYHDIFTLLGAPAGMGLKYPVVLGNEGAGVLDDGSEVLIYPVMGSSDFTGDDITTDPERYVIGEKVHGALAEYAVVPAANVVPKPKEMSMRTAGVIGIAWLTAYRMLFTKSGLIRRGQRMLVQGSTGGVATALIQLGRAAGMVVWATGRTPAKRQLAHDLGAHQVFEPGETLPEKVDAVFNLSGASTWEHGMASVANGGSIVVCAIHAGASVELDLFQVLVRQVRISGVYAGTMDEFKSLISFLVEHAIEPYIDVELPLERAAEGLRAMLEGNVKGKILVTV